MTNTTTDRAQGTAPGAEIRSRLGHPVIDADGHWVEYAPVLRDAMARIGGEAAARGFGSFSAGVERSLAMSVADDDDFQPDAVLALSHVNDSSDAVPARLPFASMSSRRIVTCAENTSQFPDAARSASCSAVCELTRVD